MGVCDYQLTTKFLANCQLATNFLANCQLTTNLSNFNYLLTFVFLNDRYYRKASTNYQTIGNKTIKYHSLNVKPLNIAFFSLFQSHLSHLDHFHRSYFSL